MACVVRLGPCVLGRTFWGEVWWLGSGGWGCAGSAFFLALSRRPWPSREQKRDEATLEEGFAEEEGVLRRLWQLPVCSEVRDHQGHELGCLGWLGAVWRCVVELVGWGRHSVRSSLVVGRCRGAEVSS